MEPVQGIIDWVVRLGGTGVMALGIIAIYRRWFVHHAELDRALEGEARERKRAELAEQKMLETIPALIEANKVVARAPAVAEKAIETAAATAAVKARSGDQRR